MAQYNKPTKSINNFVLSPELEKLVIKYSDKSTPAAELEAYNLKLRLTADEKSSTLMDFLKDRFTYEAISPNFTQGGTNTLRIGEFIDKQKSALNGPINQGIENIVTRKSLSQEEANKFWVVPGRGYYDEHGSNVASSFRINLETIEQNLESDLSSGNISSDYCVPGGYTGLMIILATAPHTTIVKFESLINASIETLKKRGLAEIQKYAPSSKEYEEIKQFAENLKFMKQSYGIVIANQKALDAENDNLMDF